MAGRRGRRRKKLLDDLKVKEAALGRTVWRTRLGEAVNMS